MGFPCGLVVKNAFAKEETWVWSQGQEEPQKEEMVPHSSILAWEIPWTEQSGGLQSMGLKNSGIQLSN